MIREILLLIFGQKNTSNKKVNEQIYPIAKYKCAYYISYFVSSPVSYFVSYFIFHFLLIVLIRSNATLTFSFNTVISLCIFARTITNVMNPKNIGHILIKIVNNSIVSILITSCAKSFSTTSRFCKKLYHRIIMVSF